MAGKRVQGHYQTQSLKTPQYNSVTMQSHYTKAYFEANYPNHSQSYTSEHNPSYCRALAI
jgi:hypothetical protein